MTDDALAAATVQVNQLELTARAMSTSPDESEKVAAVAVMRQAGALRRALEQWIVGRATRRVGVSTQQGEVTTHGR